MGLNREVAEKIMGWTVKEFAPGEPCLYESDDSDCYIKSLYLYRPDQDMNEAFEVVQVLQNIGFNFVLTDVKPHGERVKAEFIPDPTLLKDMESSEAIAKHPAEAICRAGLKAVENQIIVLSDAEAKRIMDTLKLTEEPTEGLKEAFEEKGLEEAYNILHEEENEKEKLRLAIKILDDMDKEGQN